jgi:hypothetical protein
LWPFPVLLSGGNIQQEQATGAASEKMNLAKNLLPGFLILYQNYKQKFFGIVKKVGRSGEIRVFSLLRTARKDLFSFDLLREHTISADDVLGCGGLWTLLPLHFRRVNRPPRIEVNTKNLWALEPKTFVMVDGKLAIILTEAFEASGDEQCSFDGSPFQMEHIAFRANF